MNIIEQMEEALKAAKYCLENRGCSGYTVEDTVEKVNAALAIPRRNCDVGTAEEQRERYCKFTDRYNPCSDRGYVRCAEDCPIHMKLEREGHGVLLCQLEWAQMPYETKEGGAK